MAVLPDEQFYKNLTKVNKETAMKLRQERKFNIVEGSTTPRIIADRYETQNKSVMYDNNFLDTKIPENEREMNIKNFISSEQYQNSHEFIDSNYVEKIPPVEPEEPEKPIESEEPEEPNESSNENSEDLNNEGL